MKKIKLAVLPGDGIGRDVTLSSVPVFEALNIPVEIIFGDIGWEYWKQEGNPIPVRTWELIKSCDATLLGATTSKPEKEALKDLPIFLQKSPPQYVSPIVQLRQQLDLYANVRPCYNVKGGNEDFKFTVIRENTEGLYSGFDFYPIPDELKSIIIKNPRWHHVSNVDVSCSLRLQSHAGLTRLFQFAFKYADQKNFDLVTFADKPNVLRNSSAFARGIFENVAGQYPHIKAEIHNVDAVALWMVRRPYDFGVIVAENMFGDILSDLGAAVMGGLGFAPSANIGEKGCYFEPVHGSAPRIKSNCANPGAMFLTIGLLLEYFGYQLESDRIKKSLQEVVNERYHLTYDLGGSASTQMMANAIIDRIISPRKVKKISFLATGSEIINGDIQDSNGKYFAKTINEKGGRVYQHIQVSDNKHEIASSLKYLLEYSDIIVVTGGLGPTSDDTTRYAISNVIKKELYFDDDAWSHVVMRLKKFNLPVVESNRQQALFPIGAAIYPNPNGTASGAYLKWQDKHIFMLPGPPKECCPMFDKFIIPTLDELNFFRKILTYRWLTLGLIEGEISPIIDEIIKSHALEIAYRWSYPYLEIKLFAEEELDIQKIISTINNELRLYLVSNDGKNAFEKLNEVLEAYPEKIQVIDNVFFGELSLNDNNARMQFIKSRRENNAILLFEMMSSRELYNQDEFTGTVTLECVGYVENQLKYQHTLKVPNRGTEIKDYAKTYFAWQLCQFIKIMRGLL